MTNTQELLERVRAKTETKTDYAVAKVLGLNQSNMRKVIEGKRVIGNKACFKLAQALDMEAAVVIAMVEEDRAKSSSDRDFWRSLQSLHLHQKTLATLAAITIGFGALTSSKSYALDLEQPHIHKYRRFWRRLLASFEKKGRMLPTAA